MIKTYRLARVLGVGTALLAVGCGSDPEQTYVDTESEEPSVLFDSLGRELGPISAEIVRANREVEGTMNLVARVETRRNELIEFYEPSPGTLLIMGAGAPDAQSGPAVAEYKNDPAAFWRELTRGAPMPEMLALAVARAPGKAQRPERQSVPPGFEAPVQTPRPADHAPPAGLGETAHLVNEFCDATYYTLPVAGYGGPLGMCQNLNYFSFSVCWDHGTNNSAAWHNDAADMKGSICPLRGNVIYKISADEDWISEGQFTVLQNTARWMTARDNNCPFDPFNDCPTIRTDVLNASGDIYQFRYQTAPE
jgi:hypothetical protein